MSASGKPVHVDTGNKNVTSYATIPFIGSFTKSHPLFTSTSDALADLTGRTFNPLNVYTDKDLLLTRVIMTFADLPALDDVNLAKQDPLIRETIGRLPSPATLCRQEMAIGSICEAERDRKLNGRRIEDLPKHDPDAIGSEFFDKCNDLLLKDKLRRIPKYPKYLVLDADSTFIKTDGRQQGASFDGKNRANGYFPLLCFLCGEIVHIQHASGATDGRRLLENDLEGIIDKIRVKFPNTPIVLRADAGFNSQKLVDICNKKKIYYLIGYTGKAPAIDMACERIRGKVVGPATAYVRGLPAKLCQVIWPAETFELGDLKPLDRPMAFCGKVEGYQSDSWTGPRDLYYRIQVNESYDVDFRFVQTNIPPNRIKFFCDKMGTSKNYCKPEDCYESRAGAKRAIDLYYGLYCYRGNCERWIKDYKDCSFGPNLSAMNFFTNWFRLLLGAIVQHIFNALKEMAFLKESHQPQWYKASFGRFLKELGRLPALLKRYRRCLLVSTATMENSRKKAFEAVVKVSY
ncbi:MAG: transposase [Burkholderiales bacterium]|nr:transposase [Burkholderiales bacterium]